MVQIRAEANGDASFLINQRHVASAARESTLRQLLAGRQERILFVRGDRDLQFSSVAEMIALGHKVNADRIGILTSATQGDQ